MYRWGVSASSKRLRSALPPVSHCVQGRVEAPLGWWQVPVRSVGCSLVLGSLLLCPAAATG